MAKIDIKFAQTDLVRTSGLPGVQPADFSGISDIAATVAKHEFDKINKKKELEQLAIDSNYNANTTIALNNEIIAAQERHKQSLFDAPDQYQAAVLADLKPVMDNAINSAPSIKAKIAMQNQVAQMTIHTGIKTANDTSEARISNFKSSFTDNMDMISGKVFNDPSKLEEAKLERLKMLEAFKTVASPSEYAAVEQATSERLDLVFLQGASSKFPEDTIKAVKSGKFNHLGAEDLAKVEYAAHQEIETRVTEQERAMEEQRQAVVLDVKSRLAQSRDLRSADSMVDEVLRRKDELGKNFPAVLNEAYSNYDGWKAKQQEVTRVATFIDSGLHLEPGNAKDERAADIAFDQFRSQYDKAGPQDKVNILTSWLDRVGVLPPSVEKGLFSTLRNGSAEAKVSAAITVDKLIDQDERLIRQFAGRMQDVALSSKIAANITYGMSATDAVKSAEKDVLEGAAMQAAQDPRRKAKIKAYEDSRTPISLGNFTSMWRDDPDKIPSDMVAEAEDYKRQLAINFDIPEDEAHERAIAMAKANWGITTINGEKEFTRNPAEKLFGGKGDTSWIQKQMHREVTAVGRTIDGKRVSAEGLIAKPVPTYLNKGKIPTYMILHDDGTGIPQPVLKEDKNKNLVPFVWRPSASTTNASAKAQKLTTEKLNKLNSEANLSAKYRVRAKILNEALDRDDVSDELKGRIRRDILPIAPKEGFVPKGISEKELNDIKPVSLKPRTGPNLNIGKP